MLEEIFATASRIGGISMDSRHLVFDSSSSNAGHMFLLGGSGSQIFRGINYPSDFLFLFLILEKFTWGFGFGNNEGARSVLGFEEATNKRRPFFTTADDLLEEEYYDEQHPEKKRRLTTEQVIPPLISA